MHEIALRRILCGRTLGMAFALVIALMLAGCKSTPNRYETPPPTKRVLSVTHHVGGTHYCTVVYDGVWYQTFGCALLLLDISNVNAAARTELPVIDTIELADFGTAGGATDMALLGNHLYVVLERTAVIEFSLTDPWSPKEVRRVSADDLGIRPMHLSIVAGALDISGDGGIVQLLAPADIPAKPEKPAKDQPILAPGVNIVMKSESEVGRVAMTPMGLATTVGRRIVSVPEQKYMGSANEIVALPSALGGPQHMAYRWDGESGSVVGLMGSDMREQSRLAFTGQVHSVKPIGDTLWIVADDTIVACNVEGDELKEARRIAVFGARDVDVIDANHLAVGGTFGRAVYRLDKDSFGPGDTFIGSHREASGLDESVFDGRFVLAGNVHEGFWLYEIERSVALANKTVMHPTEQSRTASTVRGSATLDAAGNLLNVSVAGKTYQFAPKDGTHMNCIVSVDGDIWIGTDEGIIVLNGDTPQAEVVGRMTIPGPVMMLYPMRVGGGATYVSTLGGFGVVRWILEELPFPD